MIESITNKLLSNALINFANEKSLNAKQIQLIIYTEDNNLALPQYKLLTDYKFVSNIEFDNIYNGDSKIFSLIERGALSLLNDSLEKSVSKYISKIIISISKKYDVNCSDVSIMIWSKDVQASNVSFHLYIMEIVNDKKMRLDKGKILLKDFITN